MGCCKAANSYEMLIIGRLFIGFYCGKRRLSAALLTD